MRKSIFIFLFVLIFAVPAFAMDGTETTISNNEVFNFPRYPVIWKNIAILQRPNGGYFNGNATFDIFMYDMNTGTLKQLANDGLEPGWLNTHKIASVYSSSLVYTSTSGIKLKNINTLEERLLTTTTDGACPSIYEGLVAYVKNDNNIYLLKISDGTEIPVTISGSVRPGIDSQVVDMYGDYIVWADFQDGHYHTYKISIAQERILPIFHGPSSQLDIWENYIITDDGNSYLYNLNDDTYKQISAGTNPRINNGKIVWPGWTANTIVFYDIKTGYSGSAKTSGTGYASSPVTDGEKIAYGGNDGYYRVFDITPSNEEIYSINVTGNSVTVINPYKSDNAATPEDDRIAGSIVTGAGPSDVTLSPDGKRLYVLNSTDKTVTVAQTYDYVAAETRNIGPTSKQTPVSVAGDDESNVYVAMKVTRANGVVKKITASGASSELAVGLNPSSIKISPDGNTLFVSNADSSNVTHIDISIDQATGQRKFIPLTNIATGAGPKLVKP